MDRSLLPFPLLYHPSKYHPDTEDLTADEAAREYWLDCFESGLHMVNYIFNCCFELIQLLKRNSRCSSMIYLMVFLYRRIFAVGCVKIH